MFELVFGVVVLSVLAALAAIVFLVWIFRDAIYYVFEVVAYLLQALVKVAIQGAVAVVEWVDEWAEDFEIAADPLARGLVMGVVGLLAAVGLVQLLALLRNQPWVIVTFVVTVGVGLALGLAADPDRDWSPGPFPRFGDGGGTPKLPLNL
jgi:hypothetical protein